MRKSELVVWRRGQPPLCSARETRKFVRGGTPILTPGEIDVQASCKTLWKTCDIAGTGGWDKLSGKIFRIVTPWYAKKHDAISALELTLRDLDF